MYVTYGHVCDFEHDSKYQESICIFVESAVLCMIVGVFFYDKMWLKVLFFLDQGEECDLEKRGKSSADYIRKDEVGNMPQNKEQKLPPNTDLFHIDTPL